MRILVDRLWPRGLTKTKARIDLWLRDIAPSNELRKWYAHTQEKWPEFKHRYADELRKQPQTLDILKREIARGPVTLLYSAKNTQRNNAVALREILEGSV